MNFEML